MPLGENIKKTRIERGMTQGDLEKKTGIKTTQLSRLEKPDSDPKVSTIIKIMEGLECSANTLIMDEKNITSGGALQAVMEKAERLPSSEKETIIKIIEAIYNNYKIKNL